MKKVAIGTRVKHTKATQGWYCANRVHRYGIVTKVNKHRVTVLWEDGTKSSVHEDQLTIQQPQGAVA